VLIEMQCTLLVSSRQCECGTQHSKKNIDMSVDGPIHVPMIAATECNDDWHAERIGKRKYYPISLNETRVRKAKTTEPVALEAIHAGLKKDQLGRERTHPIERGFEVGEKRSVLASVGQSNIE
jgi:hypothetical protein